MIFWQGSGFAGVKYHLSWKTTYLGGRCMQVSLYIWPVFWESKVQILQNVKFPFGDSIRLCIFSPLVYVGSLSTSTNQIQYFTTSGIANRFYDWSQPMRKSHICDVSFHWPRHWSVIDTWCNCEFVAFFTLEKCLQETIKILSYLTLSHLISSHLISSHFISSHLILWSKQHLVIQ